MSVRRVAHILPFPGIGGTEHATLRIAQALTPYNFESVIVCLEDTHELRTFFGQAGFPIITVPAPQPSIRRGLSFLQSAAALAAQLRSLDIQLVHCADALAGYHASFAGALARIPVLCHIRNRHPDMTRRVRFYLRAVNHFAFVSRNTWEHFPIPVTERRGTVIYDGIEPVPDEALRSGAGAAAKIRAEFGISSDTRLIGMVARVSPQKDYETLIAAAARIVTAHPDTRFMVVGDYSGGDINRAYYAKLRVLLENSGMDRFFVFTGYRSDVPQFLNAFDVMVLSTHQEGLPLVLIEAMARGLPVVATAVDGIPELIEDGVNGLLYSHENSFALAEKLSYLLDHPQARVSLGNRGRQTVDQKFTVGKFAASVAELYQKLLTRRAG